MSGLFEGGYAYFLNTSNCQETESTITGRGEMIHGKEFIPKEEPHDGVSRCVLFAFFVVQLISKPLHLAVTPNHPRKMALF